MSTSSSTAGGGAGRARFLDACHLRSAGATPVWFMRQAGSALPGHRLLRERYSVLELAKTPELAAELAVMPVRDLGVDAAVLYADIMLPLERMGIAVELLNSGPAIANPVRTRAAARDRARGGRALRAPVDPPRQEGAR